MCLFGGLSWPLRSYLGRDTVYSQVSGGFPESLQKDAGILVEDIAIPSKSFPVLNHSLFTLPFDGV
jgi:hypothetical protein